MSIIEFFVPKAVFHKRDVLGISRMCSANLADIRNMRERCGEIKPYALDRGTDEVTTEFMILLLEDNLLHVVGLHRKQGVSSRRLWESSRHIGRIGRGTVRSSYISCSSDSTWKLERSQQVCAWFDREVCMKVELE